MSITSHDKLLKIKSLCVLQYFLYNIFEKRIESNLELTKLFIWKWVQIICYSNKIETQKFKFMNKFMNNSKTKGV